MKLAKDCQEVVRDNPFSLEAANLVRPFRDVPGADQPCQLGQGQALTDSLLMEIVAEMTHGKAPLEEGGVCRLHRRNRAVAAFLPPCPCGPVGRRHREQHPSAGLDEVTLIIPVWSSLQRDVEHHPGE